MQESNYFLSNPNPTSTQVNASQEENLTVFPMPSKVILVVHQFMFASKNKEALYSLERWQCKSTTKKTIENTIQKPGVDITAAAPRENNSPENIHNSMSQSKHFMSRTNQQYRWKSSNEKTWQLQECMTQKQSQERLKNKTSPKWINSNRNILIHKCPIWKWAQRGKLISNNLQPTNWRGIHGRSNRNWDSSYSRIY